MRDEDLASKSIPDLAMYDSAEPGFVDHEDCLLLLGVTGPAGSYRPTGFELTGTGTDEGADRFAHLHEAHHAALNDSTSWGSALHVSARLPGFEAAFRTLLRGCRRVHETFATTAPLTMLDEHHPELDDYVRRSYPTYWRLHEAAHPLMRVAAGQNRQYLLMTQYARVCMQTLILDDLGRLALVAERTEPGSLETAPTLAPPRARDTPDGRWAMLVRAGTDVAKEAARTADAAAAALPGGVAVLAQDRPSTGASLEALGERDVLDPAHDPIWAAWETACYKVLANWLRARGAGVLDMDGHQKPTQDIVRAVSERHPRIGLGSALAHGTARDDHQVAEAVLEQARHIYSGAVSWAARTRLLDDKVIADLVGEPARIDGGAVVVVDARPAHRLARLYRWQAGSPAGDEIWVAVRRVRVTEAGPLGDVSTDHVRAGSSGSTTIEHTLLESTSDLERLLAAWDHPGRPIACVSASSLTNEEWVKSWWSVLDAKCTSFVLLDVETGRVTPGWIRAQESGTGDVEGPQAVLLGRIEVNDAGVMRHAVAMQPPGQPVWLSVHDELGASVFIQAIRQTPGLRVETTVAHLEPLGAELRVLLTHLLATESFFDANGLSGFGGLGVLGGSGGPDGARSPNGQ